MSSDENYSLDSDDGFDDDIYGGDDDDKLDQLMEKEKGVDDSSDTESSASEHIVDDEVDEPDSIDIKGISDHNKVIVIVKPENRRTSSFMSKFEQTEHISIRATQIAQHNNCMVDITGLDDPIKMAKRELMMRMSPLVIERHVGEMRNKNGEIESYYEHWSPNEMSFSTVYPDVL